MQKLLAIFFITLLSFSTLQAEQKKQMTKEEFMKIIMQQEQRKKDAKAKTKETEELKKSVNKLAKTLGVDKWKDYISNIVFFNLKILH